MSKGKHGNKEAKKPKKVVSAVKPPIATPAVPVAPPGQRPAAPRK